MRTVWIKKNNQQAYYRYTGTKTVWKDNQPTWEPQDPAELACLSYGDLEEFKGEVTEENKKDLFIMPQYMTGSDYCSSGTVEKSNHRVMLKEYGKRAGVYDVSGGYGTFAIAIRADVAEQDDIKELLDGLEDYCVIDEDDHSSLQSELEDEHWNNFLRRETIRSLEASLEEYLPDLELDGDDCLYSELQDAMEEANEYFQFESGCNVYLDTEKVFPLLEDYFLAKKVPDESLPLLISRNWKSKKAHEIYESRLKGRGSCQNSLLPVK